MHLPGSQKYFPAVRYCYLSRKNFRRRKGLQRLSRKDGALAVVYVNGERTAEYPLAEDTTVTLHAPNGGYNILVISGGTADVTEASCPDGICVRAKAAQYEGDTIVCLPNKTEIRIEGAASADIDLVS